jgi:tetratricopeptide (TPR) repeat protein
MRRCRTGKETSDVVVLPEGPKKANLSALFNDIYETKARGDRIRLEELIERGRLMLGDFTRTEAKTHDNPMWIKCVMTGGYYSAIGEYPKALSFEREGWGHAETVTQRWISAFNISDEFRRCGEGAEAILWAETALELNTSHAFSYLNLALCLYSIGAYGHGDEMLNELIGISDFESQADALAVRLRYERELDGIDTPSTRLLREKLGPGTCMEDLGRASQ